VKSAGAAAFGVVAILSEFAFAFDHFYNGY
jgi:hypothetical protein